MHTEDAPVLPRCKTCRWWEPAGPDHGSVRMPFGTCLLPGDSDPVTARALIYGATTGPDFGCVQHAAKPEGGA